MKTLLVAAWIAILSVGMRAEAIDWKPDTGCSLDFSDAVILTPPNPGSVVRKAVTILREEIQKRTGIHFDVVTRWPQAKRPVIQFAGPFATRFEGIEIPGVEGFTLAIEHEPRLAAIVCRRDPRGLLFGVGRLLRKMRLAPQAASVPVDLRSTTVPRYPLRGHQLGYRPKVNAYDAWSDSQFEHYINKVPWREDPGTLKSPRIASL